MPEKRLARARGTLPAGFQFGDGHVTHDAYARLPREKALRLVRALRMPKPDPFTIPPSWRAAHVNAAERLGWNTIEAED